MVERTILPSPASPAGGEGKGTGCRGGRLLLRETAGRWFAVVVLVLTTVLSIGPAFAAIFEVDRTDDAAGATACTSAPNDCSLRGAIIAANANPGPDMVKVPAGTYVLTLTGVDEDAAATGDLDITDTSGELRLTGAGAAETIIDANQIDRVFQILPGTTVMISGLTVRGGKASNDADPENESELYAGGGILNRGTLTITNSTVSGNTANSSGGIDTYGSTVTIANSTVSDNIALSDGGGIVNGGNMTITNSTLSRNKGCGGAIYTWGTLTITSSTLSGNSADGMDCDGGGIFIDEGAVEVANSTLSGNSSGRVGGGIAGGGQLTITNSTLSGNSAAAGGGIYTDGGTVTFTNTIVANSTSGGNCTSPDGSVTDGGHNIDDGTTCGFSAASGSLSNANPQLDPVGLQNNGGPTQTIALVAGSPAINAGDQTVCAAAPVNNLDQRGFARPGKGHTRCAIGAYEADATAPEACVGDCKGDGSVTVDEILTMVNIALGNADASTCLPGDANADHQITVDEIISAVNFALNGCR